MHDFLVDNIEFVLPNQTPLLTEDHRSESNCKDNKNFYHGTAMIKSMRISANLEVTQSKKMGCPKSYQCTIHNTENDPNKQ